MTDYTLSKQNHTNVSLLGMTIWALASAFFMYEFFLRATIGTIANMVINELHLTPSQFALLGSTYYLIYGLMQIPAGITARIFGVRHTLVFASIICSASAYCFAYSNTFTQALLSRILMGFGSSFAFICLLIIVTDWLPKKLFATFAGISQFIGTMGPLMATGPLAALLISLHGDWRYLLGKVGLIGFILSATIFFTATNQSPKSTRKSSASKPLKISNLKQLFCNKQVIYLSLYCGLVYAPMVLLGVIWGTMYLQAHYFSLDTSANAVSFVWIGYAAGCLLMGSLSDYLGKRKPILMACAFLGLISTIFILIAPGTSIMMYDALFLTTGIAAAGQSIAFAAVSESTDSHTRAAAFGMSNATITLFSASLPPVIGYLIESSANQHTSKLVAHDFYHAFIIIPILFLTALLFSSLFIKESSQQ